MTSIRILIAAALIACCPPLTASDISPKTDNSKSHDTWTRTLRDRTQRGKLQDASQRVRGDRGRWNDNPRLQAAPPISRKPAKLSMDDWYDLLERTRRRPPTPADDNWLLFQTQQLDDNDRVWIECIQRRGKRFTVVMNQAIWQGRYSKNFTYYNAYGINLGKLRPGTYEATWIIKRLAFREFEGTGRPRDGQNENWSKEEQAAEQKPSEMPVKFYVVAPQK